MASTIHDLIDRGDIFSLLRVLRRHPDHRVRTQVAKHLPELQDDTQAVEGLIRAVLDDPDPEVRQAAQSSLHQILGKSEAETAIRAYGTVEDIQPYEAEWQVYPVDENEDIDPDVDFEQLIHHEVEEEFLDFSSGQTNQSWNEDEINALILVADDDSQPQRQIQAIKILATHPTSAGLDAIARIALWSENSQVKIAARKELESIYSDETDRFIEEYRAAHLGDVEDDYQDEIEQPIEVMDKHQIQPAPFNQPPNIEPEGLGSRGLAIIFLLLLIIGALILYWMYFR